jgi:hypothetical protein
MTTPVAGFVDTMAGLRPAATTSSRAKKPTPISQRTTGVSRRIRSSSVCASSTSKAPFGS